MMSGFFSLCIFFLATRYQTRFIKNFLSGQFINLLPRNLLVSANLADHSNFQIVLEYRNLNGEEKKNKNLDKPEKSSDDKILLPAQTFLHKTFFPPGVKI